MRLFWLYLATIGLLAATVNAQPAAVNNTTVIWLSIDGFRHDYLDRFQPPELIKLAGEGAFTKAEKPVFPSLTFPNHISQVTGTTVDHHGIVMNGWYDTKLHRSFSFPGNPELIRAEPIWSTAERQGVPTATIDWPMSAAPTGVAADFYDGYFDEKETDDQRLDRVLHVLKDHRLPPATTNPAATQPTNHFTAPPRLILSYLSHVDHIGHHDGPESDEIRQAVLKTDATIKTFVDAAIEWFSATHGPDEQLYVILSTDHGMASTRVQVNLDRLIGSDLMQGVKIVTSGPMACVYLNDVPRDQKAQRVQAIRHKLADVAYLKDSPANELPADDHFADADRIGDLVVMLDLGYTFTTNRDATTKPVGDRGPRGMHGYDPNKSTDMLGAAILWRLRNPIGGKDLGPIDNTQWHATVANLLGIEPSANANRQAIQIP